MANEFNIKNGFITSGNSVVYAGLNVTSGLTATTISATTYFNLPSSSGGTFTGGTVSGGTNFTGGVTANTVSQVNYIDFTTGSTNPSQTGGRMFFDNVSNALSYYDVDNSLVPIAMGQQLYTRVYNGTGVQIDKGKVITITGTTIGLPSIRLATNNHTLQSPRPVGLAAENIPNGGTGLVLNNGILSGITLNTFANGDTLYLSDTIPGEYVNSTSSLSFTARTNEIGYVLQTGTTTGKIYVNINNEDSNLTLTDIERNILEGNVISGGVYEYTGMTQGTGQTINVAYARGWIVKNTYSFATLPDVTNVYYSGGTNIPLTYLNSADATYILINSASTLYQQTSFPTPQQRRENIFLGKVVHPNRSTITSINQTVDFDVSPMAALRDLWTPLKLINQGVIVSYYSAGTMSIQTSAGTLWGNGIGWTTNQLNPDSISISGTSPTTFQYRSRLGPITGSTSNPGDPAAPTGNTTTIDSHHYDLNGSIVPVGGNNRATNQRIYLFPTGLIRIQYGQFSYSSMANAIAGIDTEIFVEYGNNRDNGILIGILTVREDASDLSLTTDAQFRFVSKFGELLAGAGGISTTTLQQAYENSATPEIVTNSAEGALSIQNGTGAADNVTNLFEGRNTATSLTSFIRADGAFSGTSIFGTGLTATTISATTATIRKITGGSGNTNSGTYSFIGGGQSNSATGNCSVVGGGRQNTLSGSYSFIGGGLCNTASNNCSTVSGGYKNTVLSTSSFIGGGRCNISNIAGGGNTNSDVIVGGISNSTSSGYYGVGQNFIGGGVTNSICGDYNVVVGGGGNSVNDISEYSAIVGGYNNKICFAPSYSQYSVIGGGESNVLSATHSFIGGGELNTISGFTCYSVIGGGFCNRVTCNLSSVAGGVLNRISGQNSFIGGGSGNTVSGQYSFIGGGCNNITSGNTSTVGGGRCNIANGACSFIGGGQFNTASSTGSTIAGGLCNIAGGAYSFVGGGTGNTMSSSTTCFSSISSGVRNNVACRHSFIGSGSGNTIGGDFGVIVGGCGNCVSVFCNQFIGAGFANRVGGAYNSILNGICNINNGNTSVIVNGSFNCVECGSNNFIGSGYLNKTQSTYSVIVGGLQNCHTSSTYYPNDKSVIVGGQLNTTASGYYGVGHNFIGGGCSNNAGGNYSFLGGGAKNTASGYYTVVAGGFSNASTGSYTFVGGGTNNSASGNYTFVGGGEKNIINGGYYAGIISGRINCITPTVGAYVYLSTIVGGGCNFMTGNGSSNTISNSTISGGYCNRIYDSYSSIVGGESNTISGISSSLASFSTIAGGSCNSVRCSYSFIGGGSGNIARGQYSGILGGSGNTVTGNYSFAIGCGLNATSACTLYTNNIITGTISATTMSATTISATTISSRGGNVVTKISNGIDSSGNTITGAYQLVQSVLIPANTITAGDVVLFKVRYRKIGTNAAANYRIVVNTTLNLTGAQIVAQYNSGATILYSELSRTAAVKGAETEVLSPAVTNTPDDVNISTITATKLTIDWTVNQFIMYSILNSSASDTTVVSYYSISEI